MGACCGKGLTKTERAIVEGRALQKNDHDVNEVNLLLDDPFPVAVWEEVTSFLRLPHNRRQLELLQVRPDEYWDGPTTNRAALGDKRIETLALALANCTSTSDPAWSEAEQVASSGRGDEGQAAGDQSVLKSLYLDFNGIGPDGAKSLARMIAVLDHKQICALGTLSLNNNNLGDEGAIALAQALKSNRTLQRLLLRDNHIGPTGSQALADAMATNHSLIELEMSGNQGELAIQAIADALTRNTHSKYKN